MYLSQADIEVAIEAIKKSVTLCSKIRKKTSVIGSLTKFNSKVNYDEYTEGKAIASCLVLSLVIRNLCYCTQDKLMSTQPLPADAEGLHIDWPSLSPSFICSLCYLSLPLHSRDQPFPQWPSHASSTTTCVPPISNSTHKPLTTVGSSATLEFPLDLNAPHNPQVFEFRSLIF